MSKKKNKNTVKKPVSKLQELSDKIELENAKRYKRGYVPLHCASSSIPYSKLSQEDKALVDQHGTQTTGFLMTNKKIKKTKKGKGSLTDEDFNKALTENGQITDEQAVEIGKKEIQYIKKNFSSLDEFTQLVTDDVPFDQMIGWVTSLMTGGSENKSWSDVIDKFFNFRLGQMNLNELMVHKYKLEELIKSNVVDKQQDEGINYKIG